MSILALASATRAARTAANMPGLGTRASGGCVQVVNVSTQGRKVIEDPLSGWISVAAAIEVMRQIEADKAFRA